LRKADKAFEKFATKVLERDSYTCRYCGFQAQEYQEVVNLDQNYRNNALSNLATCCCFCAQCFFLDAVGKSDYGGGTLICLPEIEQPRLNGMCHVLFCAMSNATSYRNDAQSIYNNFRLRSQPVEEKLGEGMSNPAMLAKVMLESQAKNFNQIKQEVFGNLRLLPSHAKFREQIKSWAEAALDDMSETTEEE
jgi:intracellular multiplication protein IcmJ